MLAENGALAGANASATSVAVESIQLARSSETSSRKFALPGI
jgi:hypothetical protein